LTGQFTSLDQQTMESPTPDPTPPERASVWFQLAGALAAVFVVTVLAMVAAMFGDPKAPSARFFDQYGGQLIVVEVVALVIAGVIAMAADRWRAQRHNSDKPPHTGH
jgi:hypothetical protein